MTTYVDGTCHCGLNKFRVAFPTASLPISNDICHCTTCRHTTGQMGVYLITIHGAPISPTDDEPYDLSDLRAYNTSPGVTRYFCLCCSAHLFWHDTRGEAHWAVAGGALAKTEGIVKVGMHIHVADTLDGGLADHLVHVDGVELPRYAHGKGSALLPLGWRGTTREARLASGEVTRGESDEKLHAACHCRAVQFDIARPSNASSLPTCAYPDLLHAYDVTHLSTLRNPHDSKWWLRPSSTSPTRFLAGHCMCPSCRLTSGFAIQSWAFVPLANIHLPNTSIAIELDKGSNERIPGLRQYISSPGRYREGCATCGATVFAWLAGIPDLVCVSVGLVNEGAGGARAEGWLDWWLERVSFEEKAVDRGMARGLVDGLQKLEAARLTNGSTLRTRPQ
ncbi:Mss4-like protein [Crassisporium funariophilum]|nr:Mss4-like protein [Crassisporium funariophilum]